MISGPSFFAILETCQADTCKIFTHSLFINTYVFTSQAVTNSFSEQTFDHNVPLTQDGHVKGAVAAL